MQVRERDPGVRRGHKLRRLLRSFILGFITLTLSGVGAFLATPVSAAAQEEQTVEGRVSDTSGKGVEGVPITIRAAEGAFSAEVETDQGGSYSVPVPEPGRYRVSIDPGTAPEGSSIPNEVSTEGIPVTVAEGATGTVDVKLRLQEGLKGKLLDGDRQPVGGVTIVVSSEDGSFSQEAVTDPEGVWTVLVPEPGQYSVELLEDTLPEEIEPREGRSMKVEGAVVTGNSQRTVNFPLGERESVFGGKTALVLQLGAEGLRFGLLIALAAMGLSLVFGTTGLVNFAHGELVALGAILTMVLNRTGLDVFAAALIAVVLCTAFAGFQDLVLWRPLRERKTGLIAMMIVTIGMSLFLRFLYQYLVGPASQQYEQYVGQAGVEIGVVRLTPADLASMGIAVALLVSASLFLIHSRTGKAMRAVSDNPALAAASGIDVQRVILTVWLLGGLLAGTSGVLLGFAEGIKFDMGMNLLLLVFAGTILGGLGTAFGAMVGSLVVGLFIMLSTIWIPPELKNVGALVILIIILLFRPQGILGRRERIG